MYSKNVETISGMAHLINEANPKPQPKQSEFPKGKCIKLRCILEGVDYFVPDGSCGILSDEAPYCPWYIPLGYSAVGSAIKPDAIIKHVDKRFFQTGISTELVDLPAWWDRRDQ